MLKFLLYPHSARSVQSSRGPECARLAPVGADKESLRSLDACASLHRAPQLSQWNQNAPSADQGCPPSRRHPQRDHSTGIWRRKPGEDLL